MNLSTTIFSLTLLMLALSGYSKELPQKTDENSVQLFYLVDEVNREVRHLGEGPRSCQLGTPNPTAPDQAHRIIKSVLGDPKDRLFEVSVVSETYVKELFDEMAAQKHIPFGYPNDGCYARADEMARLLDKKGVVTAKAFLEGELWVDIKGHPNGGVDWWYHVAPLVKVRDKHGKEKLYVIDPSLFKEAVPLQTWINIQTKRSVNYPYEHYETPRFNYDPDDKDRFMVDYDKDLIKRTEQVLPEYLKAQEELKKYMKP